MALALVLIGWRRRCQVRAVAWDLAAWLGLAALVAWLYAPYLHGTIVGGGDAYHYTLQVADYVTQLRTGHFPVFVGQTAYGFNGNIHTLRTAPYLLHFVGFLDFITGRRLSFPELLDLTLLLHALGTAFSAWRVTRFILGEAGEKYAVGLAALYALSPAIAGTVQAFDLIATFMTLPWLPLLLGAIVMLLEGSAWRGAVLGSWALAIIWWAHPAVGLWATLLWALAWGFALCRRRTLLLGGLAAFSASGLAMMSAYCFFSVHWLHLGYDLGTAFKVRTDILAAVGPIWPEFIFYRLNDPATILRPGYALWIFGLVPLFSRRVRSDAPRLLLCCLAGLVLLMGAAPFLTTWIWLLVPNSVLQVTNTSIVSRSPAMMAVLLLTTGALGLRSLHGSSRKQRGWVGLALAAAVGLSAFAVGPMRRAAVASAWTPADSANALDLRNVNLTRSSYEMFGRLPAYFTNGRTSAPWEVRLLDSEALAVSVSNGEAVVAQAQARGSVPPWHEVAGDKLSLPTVPDRGYVLEFSFAPQMAAGELQLTGQSLARHYALPNSGRAAAFGSSPGNSPLIGYMPGEQDGHAIVLRATVPGASVRAYPFAPADLPLQVQSLGPLRVRINAPKSAWFESPLVWMPGYHGTVDGEEAPVFASPERMVMVRVPAGVHVAEIRYVPPPPLDLAYRMSLLTLAGWTVLVATGWRPRLPSWLAMQRASGLALGALLTAGLAAGIVAFVHRSVRHGAVRLTLVMPWEVPTGSQPLLVTGKTGAADVVYVHFLSNRRLQVGFDDWGKGGPVSAPIPYWPGQEVEIDVAYATLYGSHLAKAPARFRDPAHSAVVVRWNGRTALDLISPVHLGSAAYPAVGINAIGASTCSEYFTGEIRDVSRLETGDLAGK
jgi:hypothetical protein